MLLSELLDRSELGLSLLHDGANRLESPLGRLVTIDLIDPGRYLRGGEVVLTGLVWRRDAADSERFVKSLAERDVPVLLAGRALLGEIPEDLLDACRRHGVTLVAVPTEVSFADVTEHVLRATSSADSAGLARQRALLTAMASGRSLDEIVARVSADIGHQCRIITPIGRHVVPGPAELDEATVDAVTAAFLTSARLPAVSDPEEGAHAFSMFPVGSVLDSRLSAWILAVEGDHREWPRFQTDAVTELCAVAALDRSRREEGLRTMRPIVGDAIAVARRGGSAAEVATRLGQAGIPADATLVVAVASLSGPGEALAVLEDLALTLGSPVVDEDDGDLAVAVLPDSPGLSASVQAALSRLRPGLVRGRLAVGLSHPAAADTLAGALEQARFAHRIACGSANSSTSPVTVVGSAEVTSHVLLLAAVPDDVRRTFAQQVLGAVLAHDRSGQSVLLPTLAEFLACSGSWSRTAASLHLHVNTVRYRIQRVEELTGKDLARLEDRVDVYLALESL